MIGIKMGTPEATLVRLAQLWENGSRYGMIAANWAFFFVEMELVVKEYASKMVKPRAKRCRLVERWESRPRIDWDNPLSVANHSRYWRDWKENVHVKCGQSRKHEAR